MSLNHIPTLSNIASSHSIKAGDPITLVDRTRDDTEQLSSQPDTEPTTPAAEPGLRKRLTHQSSNFQESLRREINRQKYARYGQNRYHTDEDDNSATRPAAPGREDTTATVNSQGADEVLSPAQKTYLERAQARARAVLNRKKNYGNRRNEEDAVIDVLYENQRGAFLFGIPKYSSSSLLPSDPRPWQNGQFRTSPMDIRNAQVPDPSWQWAWKSWYVDMSHDVDEEGWEYSFAFVGRQGRTFAWHGNHPWFHSFVRRRRWLRLRKRKDIPQAKDKAHNLTADYFTIHTKNQKPRSLSDSRAGSTTIANVLARSSVEPEAAVEDMEINNIADLFLALRRASLDRQKLAAIRKFIDNGGDELAYLSQRMDDIMGNFWYQTSRRQLLGQLIARHDPTHQTKKDLASHDHQHDDEAEQMRHENEVRHAEYLLQAIHVADEYVQKLEFESDIKRIVPDHDDHEEGRHPEPSFKNKQSAQDGIGQLHQHPEHSTSASDGMSRKSSVWFDADSKASDLDSPAFSSKPSSKVQDNDNGNDPNVPDSDDLYTTAAETPSTSSEVSGKAGGVGGRWKGKAKASTLDGVPETDDPDEMVEEVTNGVSEAEVPLEDHDQQTAGETHARNASSALIHDDEDLQEVLPESEMD